MHMKTSRTQSNGCTCTGGPYEHGPKGLQKVQAEIAARRAEPPRDPKTSQENK